MDCSRIGYHLRLNAFGQVFISIGFEEMKRATCPECDNWVELPSHVELGRRVSCSDCNSQLTVIRKSPVELDWAFLEPFEKNDARGRKDEVANL